MKWSEERIERHLSFSPSEGITRGLTYLIPKRPPNLLSFVFARVTNYQINIVRLESWHPDGYHSLVIDLISTAKTTNKNLVVKVSEYDLSLQQVFRGHFSAKYTGKRTISFDLFRRIPKAS